MVKLSSDLSGLPGRLGAAGSTVANAWGTSEGQTSPVEQIGSSSHCPERSWPPLLMWVRSLGSNWASRYWWASLDLEVSEVGCGVIVSVLSLLKSYWPECAIVFFVSGLPGPGRSFMAWWTAAAADRTLPSVSHTQGRALSIFSVTLWHTSQP